jgi:hypothetical protein
MIQLIETVSKKRAIKLTDLDVFQGSPIEIALNVSKKIGPVHNHMIILYIKQLKERWNLKIHNGI